MKKKLLACLAAMTMSIGLMSSTVFAATGTDDASNLSVTLETDKESYEEGENVRLELTVKNDSANDYENLYFELDAPDGITFPDGTATAGSLNVSANSQSTVLFTSNGVSNPSGGSDYTWIIVGAVVIVVILLVIFIVLKKKKKTKNATAAAMAFILSLSGLSIMSTTANAEAPEGLSLSVTESVNVDGSSLDITVKLSTTTINEKPTNIGIHDPSIFQDPVSGNYYSYGSHIVAGTSTDNISWSYIASSNGSYSKTNQLFSKHYLEEFAEVYEWLGADVKEGIWALDITYSKKADDAGNDPYLMYVTVVNGSFKSALCLATSDKPEGPFEYKGMIVCSDYRQSEVEAGYTNLLDVLGVDSVSDMTDEQKSYYFTADSAAYKASLPDCIDAAPFYDKDGNLYLAYGSFTCKGGLRVLKLDETTGLRSDENYEFNSDGSQDTYFGKKIANSNGEGPYILRVDTDQSSTGSYYFLFWSQGNLRATGGYNMRVFRSEYPDHGYVDYAGQNATDEIGGTNLGLRIMDGFQFTNMQYPSTANGGNSAIVTDEGKIFVHYHSKSANSAAYGKDGFIIKSNQMFLNEDGWLVTAPYKYNGETMTVLDKSQVAGDYEFIYHRLEYFKDPVNYSDNFVSPSLVTLNEDGTVSGAQTGKWTLKDNYITITIGDKEYKGVVLEQYNEGSTRSKTIVFTASGTDNRTVWGSKIMETEEERVNSDLSRLSVPENVSEDFALDTKGLMNSTITWSSDSPAIVIDGATAKIVQQDASTDVVLTATATYGSATSSITFDVTVPGEVIKIPSTVSSSTIDLPKTTAAGKAITWTSSDISVINPETGVVTVPSSGSVVVTLTGTIADSDKVVTGEVTVMPIPTTVVYEENYDSLTSIDASVEDSIWYSKNAAAAVTLQSNGDGKYVQFAPGEANSRGAISTFPASAQVDGVYVLDFDLSLKAGDNQNTEFAVTNQNMFNTNGIINDGIESGYLFKIYTTASSTTWTVSGGGSFDVAAGQWVHVKLLADTGSESVVVTITDGDTVLYEGTLKMDDTAPLMGFYIRGGRYQSVTGVDNVVLKQN